MPCQVDTSYEDAEWNKEFCKHHKIVEGLLEDVIGGKMTPKYATECLVKERQRLADAYEKIFSNLYRADAIIEGKKKIMDGGP